MIRAESLSNHIQALIKPEFENQSQLALMNFLKFLCDADTIVDATLLHRFYYRALTFSFWQENLSQLLNDTKVALRLYCDQNGTDFDFGSLINESHLQVVAMPKPHNFTMLVSRFLESELTGLDQYRVFSERDGRAVGVIQTVDQTIRVIAFPAWGALIEGELTPLCSEFALSYTTDLNLLPDFAHQLEIAPHMHARFRIQTPGQAPAQAAASETLNGIVTRGATFQPYLTFSNTSILREAHLFYPLKRLEQFFVDRKTDPVYVEMTASLDKATELLLSRHPEGRKYAAAVLDRSRLAIEQIFPDDKTLHVQVQNLERALTLETTWITK
jgi:hypothetical protein